MKRSVAQVAGLVVAFLAVLALAMSGSASAQGTPDLEIGGATPANNATVNAGNVRLSGGIDTIFSSQEARVAIRNKGTGEWMNNSGQFVTAFSLLNTEVRGRPLPPGEPCCPSEFWFKDVNLGTGNYGFYVEVSDNEGLHRRIWSNFKVQGAVTPKAPVSCTATLRNGAYTVDWNRASADNAAKFIIRRSRNNGTFYWAGRKDAPATSGVAQGALVPNSSYRFSVETHAANGTRSAKKICTTTAGFTYSVDGDVQNGTCFTVTGQFSNYRITVKRVSTGSWLRTGNSASQAQNPQFGAWKVAPIVLVNQQQEPNLYSSCLQDAGIKLPAGNYYSGLRLLDGSGAVIGSAWKPFTVS